MNNYIAIVKSKSVPIKPLHIFLLKLFNRHKHHRNIDKNIHTFITTLQKRCTFKGLTQVGSHRYSTSNSIRFISNLRVCSFVCNSKSKRSASNAHNKLVLIKCRIGFIFLHFFGN